jgi:hypothetical protein
MMVTKNEDLTASERRDLPVMLHGESCPPVSSMDRWMISFITRTQP